MLPGPISEIVPCSRTFRYGRMQAIILWIGFVWRRGVLGYAFEFLRSFGAFGVVWMLVPTVVSVVASRLLRVI